MITTPRHVTATDGARLAVYESGEPTAPTIVAVHGYPDDHTVWDGATVRLAERFRVVRYDVRGAGESDRPARRSAYRMDQLVADLAAVIDAVSPAAAVHLLAHDWGSIQSWPALTDPRLAGRVRSFTSISGPSLDHAGGWLRSAHRHPRESLGQLVHSYYIGLFQVPGLPELLARTGTLNRALRLTAARHRSSSALDTPAAPSESDEVDGLSLYRANMLGRLTRPRPQHIEVPVQLIVPAKDAYVTPALAVGAATPWVDELTVRHVAGGHWMVRERPDVIAGLVEQFVSGSPGEERRLVLVTGGGRGIGRATALEFARSGADVVVADIDDIAAKQTVAEIGRLGVHGWAEHLDVADAEQWTAFAARVREEHGVPDVVVNNAGIGMGGTFLGTSPDDWRRILDVNLWSVIHGSRLFAAQQIERGRGGHIVNVASAAAFSPSIVYPAYATSKAAVLMLTECLRAELAREGIGVTAICPGFIDTDISRTTIHVGVDAAEAKRRQEHQIASYRRRGYTPEKVARQVVRAVAADTPVAVITPEAKLLHAISRFAPGLGRQVAKLDLNKL